MRVLCLCETQEGHIEDIDDANRLPSDTKTGERNRTCYVDQ